MNDTLPDQKRLTKVDVRRIPAVLLRGGTSRGLFLHAADVPRDGAERDAVLLALMGSPHPLQVDGLGGGHSSTSKVMIDAKTGTNQIYLPLDRLLAQSTANEAARGANSGPVMAPQQNPAQPAPQQQAQPQPQAQQPAPAAAPAQSQPQPQPETSAGDSNRTRDLRSRDTGRERESR